MKHVITRAWQSHAAQSRPANAGEGAQESLILEPISSTRGRWRWISIQPNGSARSGEDGLIDLCMKFPIIGECSGLIENLQDDHVMEEGLARVRPWDGIINYQAGHPDERAIAIAMSVSTNRVLEEEWPGIPVRIRAARDASRGRTRKDNSNLSKMPSSIWEQAVGRLLNGRCTSHLTGERSAHSIHEDRLNGVWKNTRPVTVEAAQEHKEKI